MPDAFRVSDDAAHQLYLEAPRLHLRGGRTAAAEQAYRDAIAAGYVAAWPHLGVLLSALPGRELDAKGALRLAAADEDPAISSYAALTLAGMLDKLDGDIVGARDRYEFAAEHGTGSVWENATVNLAFIRATEGDREGAIAAYQAFIARRYRLSALDVPSDGARGFAAAFVSLVMRPRSRRLLRRTAVIAYRLRRLRRRLLPGGLAARLRR